MNILSTILDRLNQRIEVGNIFDKIYGLSELVGEGNDKAWAFYIGNGQAIPVTDYDAKQGTLFWAKRGKINVTKNDSLKLAGCRSIYETRFSMTAYAMVRKSHLPCDSADAQDWVASRVLRLISGTDPQFKTAIGAIAYEVVPSGYQNEIKYLPVNYEWAAVAIDVDVNVSTSSEDGCYDTCQTGDIPLPDFEPCEPCLISVAVDGVTITGNGTPADPLVAIGGGGGTPLTTQEEGTNVSTNTTTLNFTGSGVTASLTSPGVVEVNVPGGGGGGEDLQQTTDIGNSTTNNIAFTGAAGLSFDNGAFFRKGTTDAGNGGAKGTAQICSLSYELKWEAGRLYYMEQDGFTIRDVTHNFTFVPQVTDDSSKGFVVGSRWSLDDGTVYLCSDATIGAAVWAVQTASVGSLQDVTDVGNITTNDLIVQGPNDFIGQVSSQSISVFNTVSNAYAELFVTTNGQLTLSDGTSAGILSVNNLVNSNVQLEFPNKVTGNYTIATTTDIPNTIVESVTATSPVASSGGANPDISISQSSASSDGYLSSADWNTFDGKFDVPTGSNTDYLDGTGAPQPFPTLTNGTVTSVAATVPNPTNPAFSVAVPNSTTTPSVDITANGVVSQYIRGDGSLANFPLGGGGGASVNYYLNGSISQGTIGGNAYFQMSRTPVLGGGTNFTRTQAQGNGYIAQFITNAGDPNLLAIPSGNWNFETYFSASSNGGSPSFYIELYKYDGATFTLISTGATNPEAITGGTVVDLYVSALAVPSTVLVATDRLAVRIFVTTSGRTITLHTEDNNLCQVITTFTTGLNALNGLTAQVQNFATGTSGTDFGISSASSTHTFNLPTASASNRGALSTADWTTFNGKFNTPSGTTSQYVRGDGSLASLPFELVVAASDETTALTAGTAKITFRMPRAVTLTSVRASLTTAQASGNIFTVDINEAGTSILSTKLTIDNTEKTSTTAATPPVISDANLADDAEMTIDIDQIGDGTAKGLKVTLIGTRA